MLALVLLSWIVPFAHPAHARPFDEPVTVDGVFAPAEWARLEASALRSPLLDVRIQSSQSYLYVAIAFFADDGVTSSELSAGRFRDAFRLFLDVDGNGATASEADVVVSPSPDGKRVDVARTSGGRWGRPASVRGGRLAPGSAQHDGGKHRTWEIGVPLEALGVEPLAKLRWAIQLTSAEPQLSLMTPSRTGADVTQMHATQLSPYRLLEAPDAAVAGRPALREAVLDRSRVAAVGRPVAGPSRSPAPAAVVREILPGGVVVLRHPDGRVERHDDSGVTITYPDGTARSLRFLEVQQSYPSAPPSADERPWLEAHAQRLLDHIETLTQPQEDALENYLAKERERANNVYERIHWRTKCIGILL